MGWTNAILLLTECANNYTLEPELAQRIEKELKRWEKSTGNEVSYG